MALVPITTESSALENGGSFRVAPELERSLQACVGSAKRLAISGEVRAHAWVEREVVTALIYNDELAALAPDQTGSFTPAAAPQTSIGVGRAPVPATPWDRSTSHVRFRIVATNGGMLAAGTVGWVKMTPRAHDVLVVPAAAVLQANDGPYVLAVSSEDHRRLTRRRVEIASVFSDLATVVSGLRENEPFVANDAFFFDAEGRLHGAMP